MQAFLAYQKKNHFSCIRSTILLNMTSYIFSFLHISGLLVRDFLDPNPYSVTGNQCLESAPTTSFIMKRNNNMWV